LALDAEFSGEHSLDCFQLSFLGRRISPDFDLFKGVYRLGFRLIFDRWNRLIDEWAISSWRLAQVTSNQIVASRRESDVSRETAVTTCRSILALRGQCSSSNAMYTKSPPLAHADWSSLTHESLQFRAMLLTSFSNH
jgi:hypothetical protein